MQEGSPDGFPCEAVTLPAPSFFGPHNINFIPCLFEVVWTVWSNLLDLGPLPRPKVDVKEVNGGRRRKLH